jgi:cytosine/adenosine deaminase-related metal-dependent hydrolase
MLHVHRAAWVLPISGPPIRDGWVSVDAGRIVNLGADARPAQNDLCILPGLVNAHTHLEVSWMRGQVPPAEAMPAWAGRLVAIRRSAGADDPDAIHAAIREARAAGTALVGDVSNSLASWEPLVASPLSAAVFYELIGFRSPDANGVIADARARLASLPNCDRLASTIVPHAPYSVSPDLFRAIARATGERPMSVHVGESIEEIQFLRDGRGTWRNLLESFGAWTDAWTPPASGPVAYLDGLGLLTDRLLAVHAVHLTDDELQRLGSVGATVVACPRSNRWTGAGTPPIAKFYASGVRVAIGTDSLASVEDLSMFAELAAVRALASDVPARRLLASATIDGARALGFDEHLGSIEPGKRAELLAVRVPPDVDDVEEYLVSGVPLVDVSWVE